MRRGREVVSWTVGGVFVLSGVWKASAVSAPAFRDTLVWALSGGSVVAVAALAGAEVLLGSLFAFGLWRVFVGRVLLILVIVFSASILIGTQLADGPRPCGCLGIPTTSETSASVMIIDLLHNVILVAAILWAVPECVAWRVARAAPRW